VSERDDGGPAFPTITNVADESGHLHRVVTGGMSLRDHFAAKIIAARLSYLRGWPVEADEIQALAAYQLADAMLKARKS